MKKIVYVIFLSHFIFIIKFMKIFFILLSVLAFMCFEKYVLKENVNRKGVLVFIGIEMVSSLFLSSSHFYSMIIMFTYLACLFYQDKKTYYISKWWIIPTVLVTLIFNGRYSIASSFLFGVPCMILYFLRKEWIGSADVCFMFYFGLVLGIEKMFVCMFIAIFLGFIFLLFSKNKLVPFVSCLCIGAWIALLKGYGIYFSIYGMILT